ncbi:MAG: hypothetical protein OXI43_10065 [Candidatus Poribacteria bacterium]|nr:hypothetical protein [Candidatus Poribacteria bacterium]
MSKNTEKIPNFTERVNEWAVNALAAMPVKMAVDHFLMIFKEYNDPKYGTDEEIRKAITTRFYSLKSNKNRPYHELIKSREEILKNDLLDIFPYTDELQQLVKLHELLLYEDLKPMEKVRIFSEIRKLCDRLKGIDGIPAAQNGTGWAGANAEFESAPIGQAHKNLHEDRGYPSTDRNV